MMRCIQVGRSTIQGRVIATYPDPSGDFGKMRAFGGEIIGRLTPQERATPRVVRRARYSDAEMAIIKRWMAGE